MGLGGLGNGAGSSSKGGSVNQLAYRTGSAAGLVAISCCMAGCFLGYDSQWGATKRAQQAAAKHATPSELDATPADPSRSTASLHRLELRAYVSPRYSAEVTDERRQLARVVDNANEVLGPTLRLRLDLKEVRHWPATDERDLEVLIDELVALDPAQDGSWIVGFVGRPPTLQVSFEELGMAKLFGKHFVMRAMNDAAEYDAIESGLDELDEDRRRKLYRQRLRHKETAVFLHEIGHTLGVPHEIDKTTLMHPKYGHEATGFSPIAAQLMRMTLSQRLDPETMSLPMVARELIGKVKSTSSTWVEEDREAWLAMVQPLANPAEAAQKRPAHFDAARWQALTTAERVIFHALLKDEEAGNHTDAFARAKPLYEAHPDIIEIQDVRCRLALRIGGPPKEVQAHCADFTRLESQRRQ
jgi:hypothetical protein